MAFVVEDGTGKADANSYCSVAAADAYFADRGNVAWAGTDQQKQAWLVQATDYIDMRFSARFLGSRMYTDSPSQALEFPRVDNGGQVMPVNLIRACAEYALRAKSGPLAPDPVTDPSGYAVQSSTKKVGPIEKTTAFAVSPGSARHVIKPYPAADMLLRPLLRSGGSVIRN